MKKLLFLLALVPWHMAQAVFVAAEIWKAPQGQTIVCLGDLHNQNPWSKALAQAEGKQLNDMFDCTKRLSNNKTHFIIEDTLDASDAINHFYTIGMRLGSYIPGRIELPKILRRLSAKCRSYGFSAYSAECRRSTYASMASTLDNMQSVIEQCRARYVLHDPLKDFCETKFIEAVDGRERILKDIDVILSTTNYGDANEPYEWYKNNFMVTHTMHYYFNTLKQYGNEMFDLQMFDVNLVDVKIAQNIQKSLAEGKQHIFICAGALHIEGIDMALKALGCQLVHRVEKYKSSTKIADDYEWGIIDIQKEFVHIPQTKKSDDQQLVAAAALGGFGALSAFRAAQEWYTTNKWQGTQYRQPARTPMIMPNYAMRRPVISALAPSITRLLFKR